MLRQTKRLRLALTVPLVAAALLLGSRGAVQVQARPAIGVTWTQVATPVTAADIGVGPGGEVWITGTNGSLYQLNGTAFTQVPFSALSFTGQNAGTPARVAVGPNGVALVIDSTGELYRGGTGGWADTGIGPILDVGVSTSGDVWVVKSAGGTLQQWPGLTTSDLNGPRSYNNFGTANATRVAAGPAGTVWAVANGGGALRQVTSAFTPVPAQAQDVGIGANGAIWITGTDKSIARWSGTGWDAASAGLGVAIAVGPDGSPWVVGIDGAVWQGTASGASAPTAAPPVAMTPATVTSTPIVAFLCKYADKPTFEPQSVAQIQALIGGPNGLDAYIQQMSYGAVNLSGSQVYGWYTLPANEGTYTANADRSQLSNDCAAGNPQAQLPANAIVMVFTNGAIFPNGSEGGVTYTNSYIRNGATQTLRTIAFSAIGSTSPALVAHELGHAFGMNHAASQFDSDPWDPMGAAPLGDDPSASNSPQVGPLGPGYSAYHRDLAGWIPAARKFVYAGTKQQITLTRLTLPTTSDYLVAQVPAGQGPNFYDVELRTWVGFDGVNGAPGGRSGFGNVLPGEAVIIHLVNPKATLADDFDETLVTANLNDSGKSPGAMWTPGKTFTDQANNISIQINAIDTVRGTAQITISPAGQ